MPIQIELCERVDKIMDQVEELDENNIDLKNEVKTAEQDLEEFAISKAGKNPGLIIGDMMRKWNAEHIDTPAEL